MLNRQNPTQTDAWKKLQAHYEYISEVPMRQLFARDPERFNRFSIKFEEMLVDFSKNRLTEETIGLLLELAESCKLGSHRENVQRSEN